MFAVNIEIIRYVEKRRTQKIFTYELSEPQDKHFLEVIVEFYRGPEACRIPFLFLFSSEQNKWFVMIMANCFFIDRYNINDVQ